MHLIMGPVGEAVFQTLAEHQPFDRTDYVRRLAELPGDWPPPEELGPRGRRGSPACHAMRRSSTSATSTPSPTPPETRPDGWRTRHGP